MMSWSKNFIITIITQPQKIFADPVAFLSGTYIYIYTCIFIYMYTLSLLKHHTTTH